MKNNQYDNYYAPEIVDNGLKWQDTRDSLSLFILKTFGRMAVGLLITFAVSALAFFAGIGNLLYRMPFLPIVLAVLEVVVVVVFSARLMKISAGTASALFFTYALLNGLTFSAFFIMYDVAVMIAAFGLAALFFGLLAAYGYLTKTDLSKLRPILTCALLFSCAYWLIALIFRFEMGSVLMSYVGLVIFMAYTAYDLQKLKRVYEQCGHDEVMAKKASVYGALQLYLDFINIFIYILRLLGRRNKD